MPQDRGGLLAEGGGEPACLLGQPLRKCPPLPAVGTASRRGRHSFPVSLLIVNRNKESKWSKEEKAGFILKK